MAYVSSVNQRQTARKTEVKNAKSDVVSMDNNLLDKNQLMEAQRRAQEAEAALEEAKKQGGSQPAGGPGSSNASGQQAQLPPFCPPSWGGARAKR